MRQNWRGLRGRAMAMAMALAGLSGIAIAQSGREDGSFGDDRIASVAPRGSVTNLPIPRFVSLKSSEGNARRGPSKSHRIDWVFTRRGLPLEVTAEFGHWRRVHALDGSGGWIHYALLTGVRNVVVTEDRAEMRILPRMDAAVRVLAEKGVIAQLGRCNPGWCRISSGGYNGWIERESIWGIHPGETRN